MDVCVLNSLNHLRMLKCACACACDCAHVVMCFHVRYTVPGREDILIIPKVHLESRGGHHYYGRVRPEPYLYPTPPLNKAHPASHGLHLS